MTGPDEWKAIIAEACAGFRLDCIGRRPSGYQKTMINMLLSELISLRLQQAYAPVFGSLQRIERQLAILADSGRGWEPPAERPQIPPMGRNELPEFLR